MTLGVGQGVQDATIQPGWPQWHVITQSCILEGCESWRGNDHMVTRVLGSHLIYKTEYLCD